MTEPTDPTPRLRAAQVLCTALEAAGVPYNRLDTNELSCVALDLVLSIWVDDVHVRWRTPPDFENWTRYALDDADVAVVAAVRCYRLLTAGGLGAARRLADAGDEP